MFLSIFILLAPTKFLNGELKDGAEYAVFQRSFSEDGDYEDEGFIEFKTAKDNTVLIVAIVVSLLVVVAVIAVGIFIYRRRQNSARDEEEVEMPLKPRKRTVTNRFRGRGSGAFGELRLQYPCHAPSSQCVLHAFRNYCRLTSGSHSIFAM